MTPRLSKIAPKIAQDTLENNIVYTLTLALRTSYAEHGLREFHSYAEHALRREDFCEKVEGVLLGSRGRADLSHSMLLLHKTPAAWMLHTFWSRAVLCV
jgi:hypothetical protein